MSGGRAALWLTGAFLLRLAFGLSGELWGDDELQVFLIGLEFYETGDWPLFGPDVVYTQTRIPGGLQGLLVGGPLFIVPVPEAPYVLLNALSFASLSLLAWYIGRRVPSVPRGLLWAWVLFSPWTLDVSAHIVNTSYVLTGGVAFFVAACELVPSLRVGAIARPAAYALLGFGLLWVYQLHLSYALLVPVAIVVFGLAWRGDGRLPAAGVGWFAAGAALSGATLVPTIVALGPSGLVGGTGANLSFEIASLLRLPEVVARFLSLAAFELARFAGSSTEARLDFLAAYPWAAPFAVAAALGGLLQTVVLFACLFRRSHGGDDWPAVRRATIALIALVYGSFVFSVKGPASHTFYVTLPAVTIYAFSCWAPLLGRPWIRRLAVALLVCGGVAHVAIAARNLTERSLYVDRDRVVRAIAERDHRILGERRPDQWRSGG
jgi:hypothetical protein